MSEYANELFRLTGAVVVNGGHVEWHLAGLLGDRHAAARSTWEQMEADLLNRADATPGWPELEPLLLTSQRGRYAWKRNNVVHGAWQIEGSDPEHFVQSRISRKTHESPAMVMWTWDSFAGFANDLMTYADGLRRIGQLGPLGGH